MFNDNVKKKFNKNVDFIKRDYFNRITLTTKCLNDSSSIFIWAIGKNKKNIIKKIINNKEKKYPVSFLNPRESLFLYVDKNAAQNLFNGN